MKVWFNHWFSTAYYFIQQLHKHYHYVFATNYRDTCVYKTNADVFYVEPYIFGDEYVEYCLGFCKKHGIELFIPRKEMSAIVHRLEDFKSVGTKVLCESNADMFDLLSSKSSTAEYFRNLNIVNIPDFSVVTNVNEFKSAYRELESKWGEVCLKCDKGEGGESYKRITRYSPSMERVFNSTHNEYNFGYVIDCMSGSTFEPIVVMPYLNGVEISVDCLGIGDSFIAVPRYKMSGRITSIEQNSEIYEICKKFWESSKLEAPFNVQFRMHNGKLYLLEVNTRLAGGSWKDLYVGVDLVSIAAHSKMGLPYNIPSMDFIGVDLSNLEGVVVM